MNKNILSEISRLIRAEPKTNPFSDIAIHAFLVARGFCVSRHMVRKKRQQLKIPPIHKRKSIKRNISKIGKLYRSFRKESFLTQQELADILGISRSYLAGIENGHD